MYYIRNPWCVKKTGETLSVTDGDSRYIADRVHPPESVGKPLHDKIAYECLAAFIANAPATAMLLELVMAGMGRYTHTADRVQVFRAFGKTHAVAGRTPTELVRLIGVARIQEALAKYDASGANPWKS